MEGLLTFLIGSMITFYFVRRYLKSLAAVKPAATANASVAHKSAAPGQACPRCGKPLAGEGAFCSACGAPMALWNVHRAAVQTSTNGASESGKGKPRPVINATLCIGCGSCVDACPEAGTLALAGGKAILARPELCVGHARCVQACPTSALSLAFGSALQTLRAPLVKENFETNVDGVYIVGELSGMGLIKTAINEGMLAIDGIKRRLEAQGVWAPPKLDPHAPEAAGAVQAFPAPGAPYDVAIVGAGPAGLSACLTAHQHGLRYLVLEQGEIAATIRNYPRQKFLMAEPLEMPLYGSLYIVDSTKESLLKVWETIIANTGVRIQTQERVDFISREGALLKIGTPNDVYYARNVVLAMGKRGSPRKLGVPGEDLPKVAYRLIEADTYHDRDILVVGGGDSAIEGALALSKATQNRVTLSYRGRDFDRAKERNRNMLEDAERQARITIMRESNVIEILPESVILSLGNARVTLPNDFTFIMAGGQSPEDFLRKTGVEIVEKVLSA